MHIVTTGKHEVLPTSLLQMYRPQFLLVLKKIQFITNQQLSLNLLSLFHNHKPSHLSFFQDFKYFEEVNVKGAPKSKWSGSCKLCLENKEHMSYTKNPWHLFQFVFSFAKIAQFTVQAVLRKQHVESCKIFRAL